MPRQGLPPLLVNLGDRPPESLQYLGTSFGLTQSLLNFWRKGGFAPVYLRQNASDITGAANFLCPASFHLSCGILFDCLGFSKPRSYLPQLSRAWCAKAPQLVS